MAAVKVSMHDVTVSAAAVVGVIDTVCSSGRSHSFFSTGMTLSKDYIGSYIELKIVFVSGMLVVNELFYT